MKAMSKIFLTVSFMAFGFAVNAQETTPSKQDPVKKQGTAQPAKLDSKKVSTIKVKKSAPVKKQTEPAKKD